MSSLDLYSDLAFNGVLKSLTMSKLQIKLSSHGQWISKLNLFELIHQIRYDGNKESVISCINVDSINQHL